MGLGYLFVPPYFLAWLAYQAGNFTSFVLVTFGYWWLIYLMVYYKAQASYRRFAGMTDTDKRERDKDYRTRFMMFNFYGYKAIVFDAPYEEIRRIRFRYHLLNIGLLIVLVCLFWSYKLYLSGISLYYKPATGMDTPYVSAFGMALLAPIFFATLACLRSDGRQKKFDQTIADLIYRISHSTARSKTRDKAKVDIDEVHSLYPESRAFNPADYFQNALSRDALFFGFDDKNALVYYPRKQWVKDHLQIMGKTGAGKGIQATIALVQCERLYGDAVIVFDPKNDTFAPHVFKQYCRRFFLLNLNEEAPPQFNLFARMSVSELRNLLTAGFSLFDKGAESDHYRSKERELVADVVRQFKDRSCNILTLHQAFADVPHEFKETAGSILRKLKELMLLPCLFSENGFNLREVIDNGGCLYIQGNLSDPSVIALQKMLFIRIAQICAVRDPQKTFRHVNIFLDEVGYLLSKPSVDAFGTIRDKNAHFIFTHQSIPDLQGTIGADLDPQATSIKLLENAGIRWIYRQDGDTAEWAAKLTGRVTVERERRTMRATGKGQETPDKDIGVTQEDNYKYDTNVIQGLPERCALFVGGFGSKLVQTQPLPVTRGKLSLAYVDPTPLAFTSLDTYSRQAENVMYQEASDESENTENPVVHRSTKHLNDEQLAKMSDVSDIFK